MAAMKRALNSYFDKIEPVLLVLGFSFLAVYAYQVLAQPAGAAYDALSVIQALIYAFFVLDLVLRLIGAGKDLLTLAGLMQFLKRNWLAIAAAILPAFRAFRVFGVLLVIRGFAPFFRTRASKVGLVVAVSLPLTLFTAAVAALEAERGVAGSNINTFGDAIWWSIASVTTVGYGDKFPVTPDGRFIASLLMVVGIALFSALTALMAAWVMGERRLELDRERQKDE
jgi:voltage-gated potassium channel